MKRLIIISLFLSGLIWSCSEDKLDTYEEGDSVYFAVRKHRAGWQESLPYIDSTSFSFINLDVDDTTFYFQVNTLGNVVSYDRKFKVEVVKSETTAEDVKHYDDPTGEYIIPKDSTYGLVPVRFHRTSDQRDSIYRLKIRLLPTSDFRLALDKVVEDKVNEKYVDLLQHTIYFSDLVIKPITWDLALGGKDPEMGKWSVDKFLLANYLLSIKAGDWEDENYMTIGRIQATSVFMRNYLQDMIAKGTAVMDEVEPDKFMRVKNLRVPNPYTGTFVTVDELIK